MYTAWSGDNFRAPNPDPDAAGVHAIGIGRTDTPAERVWKRLIFMGSVCVNFLWPLILRSGKIAG